MLLIPIEENIQQYNVKDYQSNITEQLSFMISVGCARIPSTLSFIKLLVSVSSLLLTTVEPAVYHVMDTLEPMIAKCPDYQGVLIFHVSLEVLIFKCSD